MELTRTPAILRLDWRAGAEDKGLKVSKLSETEAAELARAYSTPGIALCKEFGVFRNFRVQAGTQGWDKVVFGNWAVLHRPSGRPLIWNLESVDEAAMVVERITNADLDWDFTAEEYAGMRDTVKTKYREAVFSAIEGTKAKSALLNGECGAVKAKTSAAATEKAISGTGRRVSIAPKDADAGSRKVSLKP